MKYNEVAAKIAEFVEAASSFAHSGSQIQTLLANSSHDSLLSHLDYAGVIPEQFSHDSREEKLFAKYCDALFAGALSALGLSSQVIDERSNSADVIATFKDKYSLVGDAKAFRLSRTAKNQKDFKVEALNQWRNGADYACLLSPLYQYPNTNSQIYRQAVRYNVTLLSYTHLAFIIRSGRMDLPSLEVLWSSSKSIEQTGRANDYWSHINKLMFSYTGKSEADWNNAIVESKDRLKEQASAEISFWKERKDKIAHLEQKEAVHQLIKALKIDSKIAVIKTTGGL